MPILQPVFSKKIKKTSHGTLRAYAFCLEKFGLCENNELVVDYPKLPKKLNVVLAREYEHEKPLELNLKVLSFF